MIHKLSKYKINPVVITKMPDSKTSKKLNMVGIDRDTDAFESGPPA